VSVESEFMIVNIIEYCATYLAVIGILTARTNLPCLFLFNWNCMSVWRW